MGTCLAPLLQALTPSASVLTRICLPAVQVEMTNVSIVLRPSRLCTPELVQEQVQGFAQLLGASGRLRTSGTTATIEKLSLPVPITQTSTGTPSEWAAGRTAGACRLLCWRATLGGPPDRMLS